MFLLYNFGSRKVNDIRMILYLWVVKILKDIFNILVMYSVYLILENICNINCMYYYIWLDYFGILYKYM